MTFVQLISLGEYIKLKEVINDAKIPKVLKTETPYCSVPSLCKK